MSRSLDERAKTAKTNERELEWLMIEYRPFILGRVYNHGFGDYDDAISIAMAAFFEAIQSYSEAKGYFLPYASKVIHSRLLDARRREARHFNNFVSVDDIGAAIENSRFASVQQEIIDRRETCRNEIVDFSTELSGWGINLDDVAAAAPRHTLTKRICRKALCALLADPSITEKIVSTKKLPIKELATRLGVGIKILDKHRRYLIASLLIRRGDYTVLQEYVPLCNGEAEEKP